MKKILAILLSLLMLLAMAACTSQNSNQNQDNGSNSTATDAPTEAPTDTPTEEPDEVEVSITPEEPDEGEASEGEASEGEDAVGADEAEAPEEPDEGEDEDTSLGLANPFVDYDTAEEAFAALDYDTELPETIGSSDKILYRVMDSTLLEVIYYEGEREIARIRKAPGSEDISGISTLFTLEEVQEVEGRQVTCKGDGEKIQLAIWVDGAYTYSVYAEEGLDFETLTAVITAFA